MPTGTLGISAEEQIEALRRRADQRHAEATAAQQLAESYYLDGERIAAVDVLSDAAAQFSEGRFSGPAIDLLRRIIADDHNASALTSVATTCLDQDDRTHLVAAVCLLGIAHEHDRADTHALELLVRAFEKMGLDDKARKVEAVLVEIAEEEPTLPTAVEQPLARPFMQSESGL